MPPNALDFLVVGSGLTGATIARALHDAGFRVLVMERRGQVGGNVVDHVHPSGIRVHTYGPHYFRTSSQRIWSYANRFGEFYRYEPSLMSYVDGSYEHWPIQQEYLLRSVGPDWRPEFIGEAANFEEAALAMMPRLVYEKFVRPYTEKQWGKPCTELSAQLAGRFDVRTNGDTRLKQSTWQGIPRLGYSAWLAAMLDGVPVSLNTDYLREAREFRPRYRTIFTGPVDAFFDYTLGRLAWRGQKRTHTFLPEVDRAQPVGQVNFPLHEQGPHIRRLEWKQMMEEPSASRIRGTLLTIEEPYTPTDASDFEYPMPDTSSADLLSQYQDLAKRERPDVLICGRLGEYRYFDMDQAIGRAFVLVDRLLQSV